METTGSLTSDFRSRATREQKLARWRVKQAANRRNKENQLALANWHREVRNSGNRKNIERPFRQGGYKNP